MSWQSKSHMEKNCKIIKTPLLKEYYQAYKYILAWNDGRDPVFNHWELVKNQCPEYRCHLTYNRSYLGINHNI